MACKTVLIALLVAAIGLAAEQLVTVNVAVVRSSWAATNDTEIVPMFQYDVRATARGLAYRTTFDTAQTITSNAVAQRIYAELVPWFTARRVQAVPGNITLEVRP
jgi:hypothetical protein